MNMVRREDILELMKNMGSINIVIDNIKPDLSLDSQGVDSLDMMSLLFDIEDKFSIKIEEEALQNYALLTIDEIVDKINLLLSTQKSQGTAP